MRNPRTPRGTPVPADHNKVTKEGRKDLSQSGKAQAGKPHHLSKEGRKDIIHSNKTRNTDKSRANRKTRSMIHEPVGTEWILGLNDHLDTCVATAFANSRLVVTGHRMDDGSVVALHNAAKVHTISRLATLLSITGTPCHYVGADLDAFFPDDGMILGVRFEEPHAVVTYQGKWISWGGLIDPDDKLVEEVWVTNWQ